MDLSISDCFNLLIPCVLLNPVLFLHCLNALLAYFLSHLEDYDCASAYLQPPLDLHKDERLCWVYTAFILFAQLIAFRRIICQKKGDMPDDKSCPDVAGRHGVGLG